MSIEELQAKTKKHWTKWCSHMVKDMEKQNLFDKLTLGAAKRAQFQIVYINGDHNIPAVFTSTEAEVGITNTLKIRQIWPEFLSRMFDVEGV